ncbi:FMN reductase [Methylobacterium nodulans]|uniref:NADPH-dependent FMN reductase n=1 Tax=Methylobacterium nodulans (strain LMG 21967 / CNCM I-2342 / ORS 2060) TaxID=460265 RepID=B8III3_METNO|nr:FMN reductase [Methylobacterium nodulans]ACL59860.1 NADPH-dependent FMN reductase [Methylobacterium nodulans ORS 2060]
MRLPRFVAFSGSPRRPSKTRSLVETVATEVANCRQVRLDIYDLVDAGPGLGAALQRQDLTLPAARIIDAIEQAAALIVGTPVYKGAYTGLFKHVFDLVDPRALIGKPVLLTATGGGPRHALVVEHALRPLFGFFEALTAPTAVYASDTDFTDGQLTDAGVLAGAGAAAQQLAGLLDDLQRSDASPETEMADRHVVRRRAAHR